MAMTTGKKLGIGVVVLVVLALGAFALLRNTGSDDKSDTAATSSTDTTAQEDTAHDDATANANGSTTGGATDAELQAAAATFTYTDKGFSPASVTVKSGDTVAIKNESSNDMRFQSDPHPSHTNNAELNVGLVSIGTAETFTVTKKGTFGFHDHFSPSHTGKITVQ